MKVGIVVGEASGDILGAGLIRALKDRLPDVETVGIGGERMLAEGFNSLFPQERLAVMGFVEPLKRLPELLSMRRTLLRYFLQNSVDLFIGIDSPDFNLTLERQLKKAGVKTVHYVSPSVWAWRQWRIKKIAASVDLVLTLFPFEAQFYHQHNIPVKFVGHPLADQLPLVPDHANAKAWLLSHSEIKPDKTVIALLPGSRRGEVKLLGPVFWQFASQLSMKKTNIEFVVVAANSLRKQQIERQLMDRSTAFTNPPVTVIEGYSHQLMAAADLVVMASGTVTLEAMLLKKPMVVAYKMAPLSAWIITRLLKSKYVALPNLLADKPLVTELLQDRATPENLVTEVLKLLDDPQQMSVLRDCFHTIHRQLQGDADQKAADAVLGLIGAHSQ